MPKRLTRNQALEYEMIVKEPKMVVKAGEVFTVETEDALNGAIVSDDQLPIAEFLGPYLERSQFNPCAGPIAVEGSRPGDLLLVTVHDIVVADRGVSCIFPGLGPLADSAKYPDCRGPFTRIIKHLPGPSGTTSDGTAVLSPTVQWKLRPHIGTIGTAPLRPILNGADTLLGQGPHGGNFDCRDIREGTTVILPVACDGGHLYVGDVHATMADGELHGVGDETRATLTLSCRILPQRSIPWVRLETQDAIIQLHSFRPIEEALRQAFLWLLDWLVDDYGFSSRDAYMQLDLNPDVRINVYQMVTQRRLNYTVGVSFPKAFL